MLEKLLRSSAEVKVLGVVLFEGNLHLREIARRAGVSPFEARRELRILSDSGVLIPEKKGNQLIFRENADCPFLGDLKGLYLKTEGAIPEIKAALGQFPGIEFAFIFGSTASGSHRAASDIDLMVIGTVEEERLSDSLMKIQSKSKKPVNYVLWTGKDLLEKVNKGSSFLKNVVKNRRIWLAGDEDEFIRIAGQGNNKKG